MMMKQIKNIFNSNRKKKIKLVISDLHLGNGVILPNGMTNSLEEFYYGEKFVEFLHYYSSNEYKNYEIELIINGDLLNFLQVDYNGHYISVITESISLQKLKNILQGHERFFAALREFAQNPNNFITYIIGNHDQGMLWPKTRAYLNQFLGISIKYINLVYEFDGFHIEHGHMQESANRFDPRKFFLKKNLPEPILNLPFGSHFFIDFVMKVKQNYPYVDKIRPFYRLVRWAMFNEIIFLIKSYFNIFVYFCRSAFLKDPRRSWNFYKLIKIFLESAIFPDLTESAKKILCTDRIHTVIFGHSHVYQYRQWAEDQEYFNTGTWTEITSLDISSLGVITKLTYVIINYPEDKNLRPRARLKQWKGYYRIEEDVVVN